MKKFLSLFLVGLLLPFSGCLNDSSKNLDTTKSVSHSKEIKGRYNDGKGGYELGNFIIMRPASKPNAFGIADVELYGKIGEIYKGGFYWQLADESREENGKVVLPTFKKNTLWTIE
jgi:hypothetical protein